MKSPSASAHLKIQSDLEVLFQKWVALAICDSDLVAASLISYFRRSLGPRWLTRYPRPPSRTQSVQTMPWWESLPWEWGQAEMQTWKGYSSLSEWISAAAVYKVSQSAFTSLAAWQRRDYRMLLLHRLPTPAEVLSLQVQGIRPVTLLIDPNSFWTPIERFPNAFELTIHDLIHADRFQKDRSQMEGQIQFFRLLKKVVDSEILAPLLQGDPDFKEDFEYVLSDMNTVPVHGLQYFKAILIQHFLRKTGALTTDKLAGDSQAEFELVYSKIVGLWFFPPSVEDSLFRMCTPAYRPEHDGPLIQDALTIHHQVGLL